MASHRAIVAPLQGRSGGWPKRSGEFLGEVPRNTHKGITMQTTTETVFIADDGRRFRSAFECQHYESQLREVNAVMSLVPPVEMPHGTYVLRDAETLRSVRRLLWAIVVREYGENYPQWKTWHADAVHPSSIVGRVLSDGTAVPLSRAWARLACFDFDLGREYQQPYFAVHPGEAVEQQNIHP